ncbi:MAG: ADOP family duplicated permease [Gemmatimonadaceae bacterium]
MKRLGSNDFPAAPRLARWLVALRVPPREREFVLGDLDEGYADRLASADIRAARLWYWSQVLSTLRSSWHIAPAPHHTRRGDGSMTSLWSDLRFVLRSLARAPLFALLVILTLTVGIGATSALFSVVYPVLLAPPPYPESDRLMMLSERAADGGDDGIGWLTFDDTRRETQVFSSMAAMSYWTPTLQSGDDVLSLNGQRVSHTFFKTLGVRPALGRDFTAEEDRMETRRVVILSDALWRSHFGADPSIVGRTTLINGTAYLVAGVMPRDFQSLLYPQAELWGPLGYEPTTESACRSCHHLRVIGRLRPGISLAGAKEQLDAYFASLKQRYPDQYGAVTARVWTLREEVSGKVRASLIGLFAAVGLLLLLACANVANLFLGRTGERQTELSVRMALGAERSRLVRLVSVEAVVLAVIGGLLGVLVAWSGTRLLVAFLQIPPALATRVSTAAPVLVFALLMTTVSALIGGTLPALLSLKESVLADIRVGSRSMVGRTRHRLRNGVVVAEVALAVMLLVGAGLQVRSLQKTLQVTTGFVAQGVETLEVGVIGPRYLPDGAARNYFAQFLERAAAVPGVQAVAISSQLPLGGGYDAWGVHRQDKPSEHPETDPDAQRFAVSPQYLDVMRIPVVKGRGFTAADRAGAPYVILLNRAAVRKIFGGDDPIGVRVRIGGSDTPDRTVVGIVDDVHHLSLERNIESQMYVPYDQFKNEESDFMVVARTSGAPSAAGQALRGVAKSLDPGSVVSKIQSMDDVVDAAMKNRRLASSLIGAFALIALLLASGGLYGVMSASVTERGREMGLRTALGASPTSVVRLVVRRGILLTTVGSAIGAAGVIAAQRLIQQFIFGVTPSDPVTLLAVVLVLTMIALIACMLPALRASRVDPAVALRGD